MQMGRFTDRLSNHTRLCSPQLDDFLILKTGRGKAMAGNTARKEVVAACMESPLYFTLPLRKRLALMKQLERQPAFSTLRRNFLGWIKTGIFSPSESFNTPPPGKTPSGRLP
jgi:hypothetical protein